MKKILCLGAMLCLFSCKRYSCDCSITGQAASTDDSYQVTAHDKSEALTKCRDKHARKSMGAKKAFCVIK